MTVHIVYSRRTCGLVTSPSAPAAVDQRRRFAVPRSLSRVTSTVAASEGAAPEKKKVRFCFSCAFLSSLSDVVTSVVLCVLMPFLFAHAQSWWQRLKAELPTPVERKKILPLTLMFFCMLFNYTILRDTKDVLVVTAPQSGMYSACHCILICPGMMAAYDGSHSCVRLSHSFA